MATNFQNYMYYRYEPKGFTALFNVTTTLPILALSLVYILLLHSYIVRA